jgi:transposase, IS5 family
MTKLRERLKKAGLEELLGKTIRTGLRGGFLKKNDLKRVNVDTTVQEKDVRYPTVARLCGSDTGLSQGGNPDI